jgi:hypothetical protein
MRHYAEPIDVCPGVVGGIEGPAQFVWRYRLYLVRDVLGFWVESSGWWRTGDTGSGERQVWRVEAGRGRLASRVIADLALNPVAEQWLLLRTYD